MTSLLLVEDDERVADALVGALDNMGYAVERAINGADALAATRPDLVLLDLGLPDIDGFSVLTQLREQSTVPLVILPARGNNDDRVRGLRQGADDYLVKPFSLSELEARIEAVLRRTTSTPADQASTIELGRLLIDPVTRLVEIDGRIVHLARKEFDLLVVLGSEPGKVFSRTDLLGKVWHTVWAGQSRTVDVHIGVLRQKIGITEAIRTIRGVGYALDLDRCKAD